MKEAADVIDIRPPDLGASASEARVLAWKHRPGDRVRAGQAIAEIETDKANFEVEAPADGFIESILVPADAVFRGDVVLARLVPSPSDPDARRSAHVREDQRPPAAEPMVRLPDGSAHAQRRCRFCNTLEVSGRIDCPRCGAPL